MKSIISATKHIGFFTIALTLALATNLAYGQWANPTAVAPADNAAAPINTSATDQIKTGSLGANELIAATKVRSDQYCDFAGNNCFSPTGSSSVSTGGGGQFEGHEWMVVPRSKGVWYTNDTDSTIVASIATWETSRVVVRKNEASDEIRLGSGNGDSRDAPHEDENIIVPPGWQYAVFANGILRWNELRPVMRMTECEVEFDYKARTNVGITTRTISRPTSGGSAAITTFQQHDQDGFRFSVTEWVASQSWGASTWDSSENVHAGYLDNFDYEVFGSSVESYAAASGLAQYASLNLTPGATASITGVATKDVPAGTVAMTATVLSCTDL